MRRSVRTITLLILMLLAVIFAVQNADRVAVDVLFWRLDASRTSQTTEAKQL